MVQIENLSFGYKRTKPLFDELNLSLPSGNIYGLLGKNGAGKSTLLKMIAGLLFPTGGKLTVEDFEPRERAPEFLQEIYLITEEFNLPQINIERFCLFPQPILSPFRPRAV